MDQSYPPPPHHSRSISHLPQLESSPTPSAPETVRPSDLLLPPNNPRRGHSDGVSIPQLQGGVPLGGQYGHNGETWMDFLRQTGAESRGRDGHPNYEAMRAAYNPQSVRGPNSSGNVVEARKRRLTAPESPQRRSSYGPMSGHGPPLGESSRSALLGSSASTAIDLTSPGPSPARTPNILQSFGGPNRNVETTRDGEIVIPRWQPDAEVQRCPVCGTQFSFWYRKHHCRKCGRVVCANCSPHRITIPRQYIVHPPITDLGGDEEEESLRYMLNPALGGGEEVRVCNPCVPDPNYNPPPQAPLQDNWQPANSFQRPFYGAPSPSMPLAHPGHPIPDDLSRLLPNFAQAYGPPSNGIQPAGPRPDIFRDGRINFHNATSVSDLFPPASSHPHRRSAPVPPFGASTPIPHHRQHHHSSSVSSRYRPPYPQGPPFQPSSHPTYSTTQQIGPPPPPRRQIPEEDECPICGDELPPKGPNGEETEREAHVQECIATHFSGGRTSREPPPAVADPPASVISSSPNEISTPEVTGSPTRPSAPVSRTSSTPGPSRPRRMTANRMLVYRATEKDCVGEDGGEQECVICFEEFKVGDEMGRLECLCKFHKDCIKQWWDTKGVGSCPTHQLHE